MLKHFYILTFIISFNFFFSQNSRFVYEVSHNSTTKYFHLDININKNISSFYEKDFQKKRDIGTELNIIKKKDSIYSFDNFDRFSYMVESSLLNWKLLKEKKIFNNYELQKAEVFAFGRNWTAWFSKKISINDGPYKFSGLPGLIFIIEDDKNEYRFNLIEIKKITEEIIFPINDAKKTDRNEFLKKKELYDSQILLFNELNNQNNLISPEDRKLILEVIERAKLENVLIGLE